MSTLTPIDLHRLTLRDRASLGLEVLQTYAQVRRVLHGEDAERAVACIRARAVVPDASEYSSEVQLLAAWRLGRVVRRSLGLMPAYSRCLHHSLTLVGMLERRRIAQTLVIAVRARPFAAHAWVEVCGEAVLPGCDPDYERLVEL